jgi:hypothetical protein
MLDRFLALIVASVLVLVTACTLATAPDELTPLPDNAVLLSALRKDASVPAIASPEFSPGTASSSSCSGSSRQPRCDGTH